MLNNDYLVLNKLDSEFISEMILSYEIALNFHYLTLLTFLPPSMLNAILDREKLLVSMVSISTSRNIL